ncbi:MAG: ADP-forming succinate--CoA ligase subunit beta [Vulcanimicrobiota bacterium]
MKIHEYQAKELLVLEKIPVPQSFLASSIEEIKKSAMQINSPVVIKAQVHTGGRGKAGGVKLAENPGMAGEIGKNILGMNIKGLIVEKALVEKALKINKEFYLGITLDRSQGKNTVIFSPAGGMEIEETAHTHPEMIFREDINPDMGLLEYQKRRLAYSVPLTKSARKSFIEILSRLYYLYIKYDCTLAEINPLVLQKDDTFIAADAKINLDDNAIGRQPELKKYEEIVADDPIEKEARHRKIAYVRLSGDIGIIGNGAGLVMATLDMVARAGGRPANFLDIGGGAGADVVSKSLDLVLMDKNIKGIFINIFGGITRCDQVALGIIKAVADLKIDKPLVIRLKGTNEEEGTEILRKNKFSTVCTMLEGAEEIVRLTA